MSISIGPNVQSAQNFFTNLGKAKEAEAKNGKGIFEFNVNNQGELAKNNESGSFTIRCHTRKFLGIMKIGTEISILGQDNKPIGLFSRNKEQVNSFMYNDNTYSAITKFRNKIRNFFGRSQRGVSDEDKRNIFQNLSNNNNIQENQKSTDESKKQNKLNDSSSIFVNVFRPMENGNADRIGVSKNQIPHNGE